ncbi:MAG: FprA family A-type flavoprotein [Armatimonadota bacterium]
MSSSAESGFRAVKVSDRVWWVGAIDWGVRDFHGYATQRGSTYNAYLILADKIALVDTVKAPFTRELLARVASVIAPGRIDYIISNHAEMDHSGGLPEVIAAVKPEKVFASVAGVKALEEHFHLGREIAAVKDGETLSLGNATLHFVEARMLHWPDSMMTYLAEDRVVLSNDAFGMHLASSERFADELDGAVLEYEAAKYYANILLPLSPLVAKLLEKVGKLNISIDAIAPSHGPVWRRDPGQVVQWYAAWANGTARKKAVIAYDTMWQSTAAMAQAIADGLAGAGVEVKVAPLRQSHRSDVAAELMGAGALVVGSPTLNNGVFPTVADLLSYLKGLKPRSLVGGGFGSYGWSGEAVGQIEAALKEMKVEVTGEGVRVRYVPDAEALARCAAYGRELGEKLTG